MGLNDFLYRCPYCGHDPLEGQGRIARCPACSTRFEPAAARASFKVTTAGQEPLEVPGHELAERIAALDGPLPRARASDGVCRFESLATARFAHLEEPLRHKGALLGFIEQYDRAARGVLVLDGRKLSFRPTRGSSWTIDLLEIRALQASSSSIQVSHGKQGVVSFRFGQDSAYRWEDLLKRRLQEVWSDAGRGEITEFQPRLRCE